MNVRFLEPAQHELAEATKYYEAQREGLGEEFAHEAAEALRRIQSFPEAWPALSKRTRCCRTKRFPYGLVYQLRPDEILIVAVMHLHRKPGYWERRLPD